MFFKLQILETSRFTCENLHLKQTFKQNQKNKIFEVIFDQEDFNFPKKKAKQLLSSPIYTV